MRIEIKKNGLTWGYAIYSDNKQKCCINGFSTKSNALESSFDVAKTQIGKMYKSTFQHQTKESFVYSITEEKTIPLVYDFGNGPVPAHQHHNGCGWIADTAHVSDTVYIGPNARVYENARVCGHARILDDARVYENAYVYGYAQICDKARIYGKARICGNSVIGDLAKVCGNIVLGGKTSVFGRNFLWGI